MKKKMKMAIKLSALSIALYFIVMRLFYFSVNSQLTDNNRESAINNMQMVVTDRATLIENDMSVDYSDLNKWTSRRTRHKSSDKRRSDKRAAPLCFYMRFVNLSITLQQRNRLFIPKECISFPIISNSFFQFKTKIPLPAIHIEASYEFMNWPI